MCRRRRRRSRDHSSTEPRERSATRRRRRRNSGDGWIFLWIFGPILIFGPGLDHASEFLMTILSFGLAGWIAEAIALQGDVSRVEAYQGVMLFAGAALVGLWFWAQEDRRRRKADEATAENQAQPA